MHTRVEPVLAIYIIITYTPHKFLQCSSGLVTWVPLYIYECMQCNKCRWNRQDWVLCKHNTIKLCIESCIYNEKSTDLLKRTALGCNVGVAPNCVNDADWVPTYFFSESDLFYIKQHKWWKTDNNSVNFACFSSMIKINMSPHRWFIERLPETHH